MVIQFVPARLFVKFYFGQVRNNIDSLNADIDDT